MRSVPTAPCVGTNKAYTATLVNSKDPWYFRGTPNGWGMTEMNQIDAGDIFKVVVTFVKEDSNPRFKIDHFGDWTEGYPAQDQPIADCARYEISFNRVTKQIEVPAQEA